MPRKRPVEYSILYTATLCLLAGGAVMVYSASSAESLLSGPGDPSYYLKRYVMFGLAGLVLAGIAALFQAPAGAPAVITVGATTSTDAESSFSNRFASRRPRNVDTPVMRTRRLAMLRSLPAVARWVSGPRSQSNQPEHAASPQHRPC